MIKYFYRLMLVVFLIVGGMQAYAAKAPANASIATQASLTYTDVNSTQQSVSSNIVTVTVNPVYSITVAPGISSSAFPGETISFPTKVTNNSNIDSAIAVYLASGNQLTNVTYTVDTNGNGVLDAGETTVLANTTIPGINLPGVMTPVVPQGGSVSLIVTGTVLTTATPGATEQYIVHGRIIVAGQDIIDFKPTSYLIKTPADVVVTKTIEQTATPGQFKYVFKFTNETPTVASNIVLTDNLPANLTVVGTTAEWTPNNWGTAKTITLAADGYEVISNEVDLSVVNGVLTFKMMESPANFTPTSQGGVLKILVKEVAGLASGTVITNTGNFTFNNGSTTITKATTTATYTVPVRKTVTMTNDLTVNLYKGARFNIPQTITNTGNTADTYTLSVTNGTNIVTPVYYLDDNGDGIRQINETTVVTETTLLQPGQTYKVFLSGIWSDTAPATTTFNTVATSKTDATSTDFSLISVTSILVGQGALLVDEINMNVNSGSEVVMPQTLTNKTGAADTFTLSIQDAADIFTSIKYYVDTNGDGIRQAGETTEIVNGLTPSIANNGTYKFFAVVTLKPTVATGTQTFRIFATATNSVSGVDWSGVTLNITGPTATVTVEKSATAITGSNSFLYTFKIKNTSTVLATNLVLVDTLPSGVEVDSTTATWTPIGQTVTKDLPLTDTGYEVISDEIAVKAISNVLTVQLKEVPAGTGVSVSGGILSLRVKAKTTTAPGTVVTNVASYTYNNGVQVTASANTNSVNYTIPTINLVLEKFQAIDANKDLTPDAAYTKDGLTANPGEGIFYKLVATNTGTGIATNINITDTIAQYVGLSVGDGTLTTKGKPVWRVNGGAFTEITNTPAVGAAGNIVATIPTINPGDIVEIFYHVKVSE